MMSTLANGGTRVTPHLRQGGRRRQRAGSRCRRRRRSRPVAIKPETLQAMRDGLWMVVNGAGTGGRAPHRGLRRRRQDRHRAGDFERRAARAARGSEMDLRDHGWFVFFAPRDNPEIAGVVFAEHGEHGYLGAPIAKHVIETYFAKKEGRPLPALPPQRRPRRRRSPTRRRRCRRSPCADGDAVAGPTAATRTVRCSNAACTSTSTGRCSAPSSRSAAIGARDDLQHDTCGCRPTPASSLDAALRASCLGLVALLVCLTHRLPHARRQVALHLRRRCSALLVYVLFFGVVRRRRAALDRPRAVQPAAVGVRQGRRSRWCSRSSSARAARRARHRRDLVDRRRR